MCYEQKYTELGVACLMKLDDCKNPCPCTFLVPRSAAVYMFVTVTVIIPPVMEIFLFGCL